MRRAAVVVCLGITGHQGPAGVPVFSLALSPDNTVDVVLFRPDLVLTALSAPATGRAGRTLAVTNAVKNVGPAPAGPFAIRLYLSADDALDTADVLLATRLVGGLPSGATSTATTMVTIPANASMSSGYRIIGVVDALGQQAETELSRTPRLRSRSSRCSKIGGVSWVGEPWQGSPCPLQGGSRMRRILIALTVLGLAVASTAAAAPEGTLTIGMHFTPVPRWLDPAEGESTITPYLLLYALHDGLLKPMPGVGSGPSLAESWAMSKDMLSADFTLRKASFHNGEPVTAEDVKFSFERYRGGGAKILKDNVKEILTPAPNKVRFVFRDPWPDFPAFYGTFVASAGWVVPKKYVERVGEDGFRKHPIGAGPYKFVSLNPGVELVVEAFEGYWRKAPSIKRIVFRSLPDETTRAAALKSGEVDLGMLLTGPTAADIKRTAGMRLVAPLLGIFWLDFPDQWDPKSPWADRRVRLAASHALDRQALNEAETLGLSKPVGSTVPRDFDFALPFEPHAWDPARAKKLLAEAGYPNGFDAGELTPFPPYNAMGETIQGWLQAVGIRTRMRAMERGAFMTAWRDKKLHGVVLTISGVSGNAATRLESFVTKNGAFAYGALPEVDDLFRRQAKELDRKKREALLHQMQKVVHDQVVQAPIYHLGFPIGVGPRMDDIMSSAIPGFYMSPYEDLKLKRP